MTGQAIGTFTVASWDENTYSELEDGGKLTRASVEFEFSGDLAAKGGWEAVMCYRQDGTARFTGLQQATGTLDGRAGSFVMLADGSYEAGAARTRWQVLEGSATGQLTGLRGSGEAVSTGGTGGTFTFDYEVG